MTTTFVIEAMAAANAQLRWKRREQEEVSVQQYFRVAISQPCGFIAKEAISWCTLVLM